MLVGHAESARNLRGSYGEAAGKPRAVLSAALRGMLGDFWDLIQLLLSILTPLLSKEVLSQT